VNILGLSAFYHESACCLLQEGRLVAAAAEERFSRVKHDPRLPVGAFRFCLEAGGIDVSQLDAVAYYEDPVKKLSRQLWAGVPAGISAGSRELPWLDPRGPERMIRERLGFEGRILVYDHHRSHAASSFFFSGLEEAAVLTADGVGEWATTTYGHATGAEIDLFEAVDFPHSLGLLYSTLTSYLGFRVNGGEYKVMGLAPYGEPRYLDEIFQLVGMREEGQFRLNLRHFDFVQGRRMYAPSLPALFRQPPREPESEITPFHHDVARSLQLALEEILLEKVAYLHRRTGARHLCLAGGVALNCVANGRIRREGPFEAVFVQPAAGDAGGCLGAAALAHIALTGARPPLGAMGHAALGPAYAPDPVAQLLEGCGLPFEDFRGRTGALLEAVAGRLAAGEVVGWFHGPMEHGPRALGNRSILASPLDPGMRDRLNAKVKKRESFRPFAPVVLQEHAREHFDLGEFSDPAGGGSLLTPFMLETCPVVSPLDLPAITHVDGSARPQVVDRAVHPRLAALLDAFHRATGCPVLVNTSFNVRGEPIVCTPVDALSCFGTSGLDCLVLEDCLLDRAAVPDHWRELLPLWRQRDGQGHREPSGEGVSGALYTFV
jgi:carbamoyltransferase